MTEYFGLDQAMKYMGFKSYNAIYRYIDEGLPVYKIGKSKRIRKSDIDQFMAEHKVIANQDK